MQNKISTKIPKHALKYFQDVVSQPPQSGYFSRCILRAIISKASAMSAIADKNLS